MKLAGVVTLYHPNKIIIKNIQTYIKELDILYVLDNTETPDIDIWVKEKLLEYSNIKYIAFGDNMGVSYAYNYVLKKTANIYDALLIMDQDSAFISGMMKKYRECIKYYEQKNPQQVGVYCVNHDQTIDKVENVPREITYAISSGSVIFIREAIELGGFDNNLFIDEVDGEFCYRIKRQGKRIIEFPFILLQHSIGNKTVHKLLGRKFIATNHNALRKYYIVRNKVYVAQKYPEVRRKYIIDILKMIIKVCLVETDKLKKIRYMFMGGIDGLRKHMGKCNISF